MSSNMSARARVLDIPELLEAILLALPLKYLLISQRVSRTFNAVVQASPHPQHALFKRNNAMDDENYRSEALDDINPLLLPRSQARNTGPSVHLPLSTHIYEHLHYFLGHIDQTACASFKNVQATYLQDLLNTSQASWLDMYFQRASQPVEVVLHCDTTANNRGRQVSIGAAVTTQTATSRELLALVMDLRRAVYGFETKMRAQQQDNGIWNVRLLDTNVELEWEDFFSAEQREKMVGVAKFSWNR